jgi:DNA topoisomerase-1
VYEHADAYAHATPPEARYVISGHFTKENLPFVLSLCDAPAPELPPAALAIALAPAALAPAALDTAPSLDTEAAILQFFKASLTHIHVYHLQRAATLTVVPPPKPLNTCSLLQLAAHELHLAPTEIMLQAQDLYEAGHITYMRTDSTAYSATFVSEVRRFLVAEFGEGFVLDVPVPATATTLASALAHEAIRVTSFIEKKVKHPRLYQLIRRHTLQSCMSAATEQEYIATVSAPHPHFHYVYKTAQTVFPGWRQLAAAKAHEHVPYLQNLKVGSTVQYKKLTAKIEMTGLPPAHFSEAGLIAALERKGIGRPSTYATLVHKLIEKKYVRIENIVGVEHTCDEYELVKANLAKITTVRTFGQEMKKLCLTKKGRRTVEFLIENFQELFVYTYTREMEEALNAVAAGQRTWQDVCVECADLVEDLINQKDLAAQTKLQFVPGLTTSPGTTSQDLTPQETNMVCADASSSESDKKSNYGFLRKLTPTAEIRSGPYGDYVFYKNARMRKPKFLKVEGFLGDHLTAPLPEVLDWFYKTYKVVDRPKN